MKQTILLSLTATLLFVGCINSTKKVELGMDPATLILTVKNSTEAPLIIHSTWGMDKKDVYDTIAIGESKDIQSNTHASSGTDIIAQSLMPPQMSQPNPANGDFRVSYGYWSDALHCTYPNTSGAPTKEHTYTGTNWIYKATWATNPINQTGNPIKNSVEFTVEKL